MTQVGLGLSAPRVPVRASVLDPDGRPVADRRLHVFLVKDAQDGSAAEHWYVPAETDDEGVAVAQLPLVGTGHVHDGEEPNEYRALVRVDEVAPKEGARGVAATHAVAAIHFE